MSKEFIEHGEKFRYRKKVVGGYIYLIECFCGVVRGDYSPKTAAEAFKKHLEEMKKK